MAENCKHGMDRRFCAFCNSAVSRGDRRSRPQSAARAQRGAMKPVNCHLDYRFEKDGRTLTLTADIVKGWRSERRGRSQRRKTFCFSEVVDAAWQGGTIHAQLSLFPRPSGLTADLATPPRLRFAGMRKQEVYLTVDPETGEETGTELVDDCCVVKGFDGILVASIDLLNESGEAPRPLHLRPNRGGHLFFEYLDDYAVTPFWLRLQVRLTFKPPQKPAPVERSFWNRFLPGGLPETNRRKY